MERERLADLRLSDDDKRMLDGSQGPARQKAMEFMVRFAQVLDVGGLCDVTWADLFCGAHDYLNVAGSLDFDRIFSTMSLCSDETVHLDKMHAGCVCYSGVEADCTEVEEGMLMDEGQKAHNLGILNRFAKSGVALSGNCIPYLTGFLPLRGEHFVSCESSAVLFMNSMWGAMGNGDGIQASFCSAVCGRTPKHGLHLAENRTASSLVRVNLQPESLHDWDLLGYTIGSQLPQMAIPVLVGDFKRPGAIELKSFFSALACAAGTEMCHITGLTPEGLTLEQALGGKQPGLTIEVDRASMNEALERLNGNPRQKIDYISLGCPHYHIDQIRGIAGYMEGKKVAQDTLVHMWTTGSIKYTARRSGYLDILEKAGIQVLTGSCPSTRGYPEGIGSVAFDAAKQRMSSAQETDADLYYGSLRQCLDTALSGFWEGC
jgi:predicted aconitase